MRGATLVLAAVVAACGNGTPKRPEQTMNGDVVLKVVVSLSDQPADAVGWGPDGVVTADGRSVAVWRGGDKVDRTLAFDGNAWGAPHDVAFLPDGVIGVAAARFDRFGKLLDDPAALALAIGGPMWTIKTASWTPDGKRLWLGAEQRPRRGSSAPAPQPSSADLVLDEHRSIVAQPADETVPWQKIVARAGVVATAGGPLSIWTAGTGARTAQRPGPPLALAVAADGTRVVAADEQGVHLLRADGSEVLLIGEPAVGVAISHDGHWIATGEAGRVRLWRVDGATAHQVAEAAQPDGLAFAVAFAPDDHGLVVGYSPRNVTVYAIEPATK